MSLIELKNVTKSFGDHKVLSDINLSIEAGDVYGVLGFIGATIWIFRKDIKKSFKASK